MKLGWKQLLELVSHLPTWMWAVLAWLFHTWRLLRFEQLNPDKCRQIHAGYQLWMGKGYSRCVVEAQHQWQEVCQPEIGWPSGYSWLWATGRRICGGSALGVATALEILAFTCLILTGYALIGQLKDTSLSKGLLFLLLFSFAPLHYLYTTECLALSCLFGVLTLALAWEKFNLYTKPFILLLLVALSYLATQYRFVFVGFWAILPLYWSWEAIQFPEKRKQLLGWIVSYSVLLISGYFMGQGNLASSSKAYYGATQANIYWENLLKFDFFGWKIFYFLNPFLRIIEKKEMGEWGIRLVGWVFTFSFLYGYYSTCIEIIRKNKQDALSRFYLLGSITIAINLAVILVFALRFEPMRIGNMKGFYSYAQETRYFAPCFLFLVVWVIKTIQITGSKALKTFVLGGILYNFLISLYLLFRIEIQELPTPGTFRYYHASVEQNLADFSDLYKKYPSSFFIVADTLSVDDGGKANPIYVVTGCAVYDAAFKWEEVTETSPTTHNWLLPKHILPPTQGWRIKDSTTYWWVMTKN